MCNEKYDIKKNIDRSIIKRYLQQRFDRIRVKMVKMRFYLGRLSLSSPWLSIYVQGLLRNEKSP